MVAKVTVEQLSPPPFMSELQQVFVAVSRETVTRALESQDPPGGAIMVDGQQLRYRGSRKRK